jgi:lysophospholipase L1-like esterase
MFFRRCLLIGLIWGATGYAEESPLLAAKTRILFQGDSITDGNRGRSADPNHILGHGYVFLLGAKHGGTFPELKLDFVNRGVSGNTVLDLEKRWQKDVLDLQPQVLSILVGVNDSGKKVPLDLFASTYNKLLTDTKQTLPKIQFVLCEPFLLPVGKKREAWEENWRDIQERQKIVAALAKQHGAALVKFQAAFDAALARAPADYWIWDGVHPTYSGHQIMQTAWEQDVRAAWGKQLAAPEK